MSLQGRSLQRYGRCAMFRQKKIAAVNRSLLAGVVAFLAFCGTFLVLHFLSRGHQASRNDFNARKEPRSEFQGSGQCRSICYTNECLRTASDILQMLDPAVNPCEDFYRYACGGYNTVPTEHRKKVVYAWLVEDEAVKFFRELIKQIPKSISEDIPGSSLTKLRRFYDSCIDTVTSEKNVVLTAITYLEHFGIKHWPELPSDFTFRDPDLDEALIRLYLYKQFPFFEIRLRIFPLRNETGRAVLSEFSPHHEMKIEVSHGYHSIFHKAEVLDEEKMTLIKEILENFVLNDTARSEILADVLSFDLALYNLIQSTDAKEVRCPENSTSECSTDLSYDCSQEEGGHQQMERFCKLAEKILDISGFFKKTSPRMIVQLQDKEHFQELGQLIESANQRTIAHALALQFLVENALFLNSGLSRKASLSDSYTNYLLEMYLQEMQEKGRSEFCTVWTSYRLPILAETAFFASKYNNTELRKEVNEIYSGIKEASLSTVQETSWLDPKAKETVEEVYSKVYFMPESRLSNVKDLSKVDTFYKEVVITEGNFLANELETRKLVTIRYLGNMDNLTKSAEYTTLPFKFSPEYDDPVWSIRFELGNLLFPSVTSNRPRYINLGYFGAVVGHELSHPVAIEIFERMYENKSQVFKDALKEKLECFANHYSQYEIYSSGQKIKGKSTFPENLPDYLGVLAAFKSLKKYEENHGSEEMLPGLHFSNEQLFFIAAAQNWCGAHTSEGLQFYLKDFHSPPHARPMGVYRNLEAFSQAFSCPSGSPMNPINKCSFQ